MRSATHPPALLLAALALVVPRAARAQDEDEDTAWPRGTERLRAIAESARVDWVDLEGPIPASARRVQIGDQWFRLAPDGHSPVGR